MNFGKWANEIRFLQIQTYKNLQSTYEKMDPKQSLILMFIMQKKCIRKRLIKTPGINYSAANCKIFSVCFNSESKMLNYRCSISKLVEGDIGWCSTISCGLKLCGHAWGRCNEGTMENGIPNERWNISIFIRSYWRKFTASWHLFSKSYQSWKKISHCYMETFYRELVQVCK